MSKTLKVDKKDPGTEICYDMERVKRFEILSTSELHRKGFTSLGCKGPWIQVTLTSDYDEDAFETLTFPSSKWNVSFD